MRSVIVVLTLAVVVLALANAYPVGEKPFYDLRDAPILFEKFVKDYNKQYKDVDDKYAHYFAFLKNLVKINTLNLQSGDQPASATFDINKFADYTPEEWGQMNGLILPPKHPVY
ncbi:hypothetical protein PYW08_016597 [Mythimna loreyi]|uniref:Uncharacterized protein n=1 Tax=Mythimna loreyi TaxID=667449 RepID=A0ACC2QYM4_9NEOP|nr:hypothetical protein PYW08_016597 [Mythimna loreyi]